MNDPRLRLIVAAGLATLLAATVTPSTFAGGGKGRSSHAGSPAATVSRGGGGGKTAATPRGGATPNRYLGRNGGLTPRHVHSRTHVVVGWPWWGAGWGWGWWGWGWPYAGYWGEYYPAYGYSRTAPPDSAAAVELHISPRKATVRVDGYEVGQARDFNDSYTPLFLTEGEHVVELSYRGYKTLKVRVHGSAGSELNLHYDLEKGEGVDSRSEAAEITPTPAPAPAPESKREPAATPSPESRGSLRTGMMRIHVEPDDAAVYLDGEFLGTADELSRLHGALSVAAGEHKVEAVRPGYRSQTITVDVREDEPGTVRISLLAEPKD